MTVSCSRDTHTSRQDQIREYFSALYRAWGRQHWWPADSPFEVIVGAFLTQNTAWTNVERALHNLRLANVLSIEGIREIPTSDLEQLIRSAGYFRQKALRLKTFVSYVDEKYGGSLQTMFARPTQQLRTELLALNGVGPETADSILLYAGQHEVFVVDAYTRRILERHGLAKPTANYENIRRWFEEALTADFARNILASTGQRLTKSAGAHHSPSTASLAQRSERAQLLNEMHGLIVGVGKNFCQSRRVDCHQCPLGPFLKRPVRLKATRSR